MKSRISFFDATVFRKNLTRFAPCWAIYTLCAFLALFMVAVSASHLSRDLVECAQLMCIVTPCYALLVAQLLFGDLYNARMCNALHALPLRRETWLGTNLISGLAFHLIPTGAMALAAWLLLNPFGGNGDCVAAWYWFAAVNLQYLCFYGIAVFSALCVGSRFAQAVVYGILNLLSALAGWLIQTIYEPMFFGVFLELDAFAWFSPMIHMIEEPFLIANVIDGQHWSVPYSSAILVTETRLEETLVFARGDGFWWYFGYAAAGIGLMALAFRLYRRRNLESAGDFIAVRPLEPVFLLVYSLCLGAVFHFFSDEFFNMDGPVLLYFGLVLGWFTGRMLLERTVRVFRRKNFFQAAALVGVLTLTMLAAFWDPMGIESWVPEPETVDHVTVSDSYYGTYGRTVHLDTPEEIEKITQLHQRTLDAYYARLADGEASYGSQSPVAITEEISKEDYENLDISFACTLHYQLKNGQEKDRHYYVRLAGEDYQFFRQLFSSPEAVFGYDEDVEQFLQANAYVNFSNTYDGTENAFSTEKDRRSLYEALMADCRAGTLCQVWDFHAGGERLFWMYLPSGETINIYADSENTLRWLRAHGVDVDWVIDRKRELDG